MQPLDFVAGTVISLRRIEVEDASALFAAANHPEVMQYMDWLRPTDVAETTAHLRKAETAWTEATEFQWAILKRTTSELVGTISCRPRAHLADFGYFLGRSHWGKGYASEAVARVVDLLFLQLDIVRVWATADAANDKSRRVLERAGLRLEGIMRMATYRPNLGGAPRDTALYARCRADV